MDRIEELENLVKEKDAIILILRQGHEREKTSLIQRNSELFQSVNELTEENQRLKATLAPKPRCQSRTYCTNKPYKGDLCEWHVCKEPDCTKPREKVFHTCEEH